jgi:hypothetical protein
LKDLQGVEREMHLKVSVRPTRSEMNTIFDIFRRLPDGKPLWIESVEGFSEAKECLFRLVSAVPGDYFIYSEKTGGVVRFSDALRSKHQAA